MGYTTDFNGSLDVKNITQEQIDYINTFSETRRMKRDVNKLMELYKGEHGLIGVTGTPEEIYGPDGSFFIGGTGSFGQSDDGSVIDYNKPPGQPSYEETRNWDFNVMWDTQQKLIKEGKCQPGLWCQWVIEGTPDDCQLVWDGSEKFYEYTAWLEYLINNFFNPWGVTLNGEIFWQGEEPTDMGKIVVTDNVVTELTGHVEYR